jgi:hypothetical protein
MDATVIETGLDIIDLAHIRRFGKLKRFQTIRNGIVTHHMNVCPILRAVPLT